MKLMIEALLSRAKQMNLLLKHIVSVCMILCSICIVFSSVLFGGKSLYPITYVGRSTEYLISQPSVLHNINNAGIYMDGGASDWVEIPIMQAANKTILNGELPLWDFYNSIGMPIVQNTNGSTLAPLGFFLNFNSSETAWNIMYLFRLFVIMLFTYLFIHKKMKNHLLSVLGSIVFGFSGYVMLYFNIFFLHVDALLPMLMYATECFFEKRSKSKWLFITATVAGMMLGGNPQNLITCTIFAILYYIFKLYEKAGNWRASLCKENMVAVAKYLLAYIFAGIITLFYWLPFIELFLNGYNYHGNGGIATLNLSALIGLLFPTRILHTAFSSLPYMGLTAIAVVFFQLQFKHVENRKEKIFLISFILLFLLKIFGFFAIQWIGYLPILNLLGFTKYNAPMYFAFMMLWIYATKDMYQNLRRKRLCMVLIVSAIGAVAWGGVYSYLNKGSIARSPYFLLAIIICLAILGIITSLRPKYIKIGVGAVISITILELMIFPAYTATLRIDTGTAFAVPDFANYIINHRENSYDRVYPVGPLLTGNISTYYDIQSITGVSATPEKRYFAFMKEFILNQNLDVQMVTTQSTGYDPRSKKFLDLLNVRYVLIDNYGKIEDFDLKPIYQSERLTIYENQTVMPRAFTVCNAVFESEESEAFEQMRSSNFNPAKTVVLPVDKGYILSDQMTNLEQDQVEISTYNSNKVIIDCQMQQNGFLVLSDLYYPGWKAYVNGEEVELLQADYIFRAVYLEQGESQVQFIYKPNAVFYGFYISLSALLLVILVFSIHHKIRERKK